MIRTNYGLDAPLGYKLPSTVCVWRWEVRDAYRDWLPRSAKEKAETRIAERVQVCISPSLDFSYHISFRPGQTFAQFSKAYRRMNGMLSSTRKVPISSLLKTPTSPIHRVTQQTNRLIQQSTKIRPLCGSRVRVSVNLKTSMYAIFCLPRVTASLINLGSQRIQLQKLDKGKSQIWRRPRRCADPI